MAARISVVVCTHNGATFVREQLESIVRQTALPDEILVSDDASTDNTVDVVREFVAEAARLAPGVSCRVVSHSAARGVRGNFEGAIRQATGDLIVLSDQDDIWYGDKLARQREMFSDSRVLLTHSNADLVDDTGAFLGNRLFDTLHMSAATFRRINSGGGFGELMKRNVVTGATVMMDRRLVEIAFPIPSAWLHDEWLGVVAAMVGGLRVTREPLISYRQHAANQIGARRLSLAMVRSRMATGRRVRHGRTLLTRAEQLLDFVSENPNSKIRAFTPLVERKVMHERVRWNLPPARIKRIPTVVREAFSGNYHAIGRGLQGMFLDIVQPGDSEVSS